MDVLTKYPYWTLILLSVAAGIVLVRLYGWISSQEKLARVKREIFANLLEAVIYRHNVALSLRAQARMLGGGAKYFTLAAPPLVILLVPCIFLLGQMNSLVGYDPADPGKPLTVSLNVKDGEADIFNAVLKVQDAEVSPPLRIPSEQRVMWRVVPEDPGAHPMRLLLPDVDAALAASLEVGTRTQGFVNYSSTWWLYRLLYPSSIDLPEAVSELEISYSEAEYSLLGMRMHWVVVFALVSLLAGLIAGKAMHIEL
ncbi:hypothetical protein [Tautonia sociabilis]|uniref:Uncharacterized protein n=1 Tax=Tautonia sociabilis TaxID=2080755 RepID=A0A432MDG1_9BACT|nr:hypothetical protein [Tautonia sociabilis]RUL82529.1 hypothetical protein TsocGM_23330 [Tautonia sociabilis]